jgi:hypothetical protein
VLLSTIENKREMPSIKNYNHRMRYSQQRLFRKLFGLLVLSILLYICRSLLNWNRHHSSSLAVTTLLVDSDVYIKGVLTLGKSLQIQLEKEKQIKVDLVVSVVLLK